MTAGSCTSRIVLHRTDAAAIGPVMEIMQAAFDPVYGEAWNLAQCSAILGSTGVWLLYATLDDKPAGFALTRAIAGEAELLLIAVQPSAQGSGIGKALLAGVVEECQRQHVDTIFLEVRACNTAVHLYDRAGFRKVGERRNYYQGTDGKFFDAHTYSLKLT